MSIIRLSDISVSRGRPAHSGRAGGLIDKVRLTTGTRKGFAIRPLTLTVPDGRTLVVLGPSGCGKSTLLRIIAGLEMPDAGTVLYNGRDVTDVKPGDRRIGMLFQSYALYPHMNSEQNITSWFFFRKKTRAMRALREEKLRRTSELLDVEIEYLLDRKPSRLSGGEKQRVALGRCITREPDLFLLDEPFSNLDAKLRNKYRLHLKMLLREFSITTVYVTHDQQEAVMLADLIAVMKMETTPEWNLGILEQTGTVQELYEHPWSTFVADFLNLHPDTPAISFVRGATVHDELGGLTLGVRPEDVRLSEGPGDAGLEATVVEATADPLQQYLVATLNLRGQDVVAKAPVASALTPGQTVRLTFRKLHVFDAATGISQPVPSGLEALLGGAPAA